MPRPHLPLTGTCRCGAVQVTLTEAPIMTAACHCTGCQKMTGSAYSLTAMVPTPGLEVTGDTVRGGLKGDMLDHRFCPDCLTWMFTRITGMDDMVNVRPVLFDDTTWFSPFIETMVVEKLPWATTPAHHRFDGFPPAADYPALMAAYAAT